ncbi:hypothetical protein [Natronorubrum halophilum]|uniref:hypothetical protein n=1 Tax=Natronorubrum halophilum TaxID=1702106 RepID=UPI0010C17A43|nr:hypothetical protein [Natronorubrum halophilum]
MSSATIYTVTLAALLAATASTVLFSAGAPELSVPIAGTMFAVVALGLAAVHAFEYCRHNGVPLLEARR